MITHPYQGHYMEAAFLDFVDFYSKQPGVINHFMALHLEMLLENDADAILQEFIDYCLAEFGTPDQIGDISS